MEKMAENRQSCFFAACAKKMRDFRAEMVSVPPSSNSPSRRDFIGAFGAVIALGQGPAFAQRRPISVLFICQFGSVKSATARELFRRRAQERGIFVEARSRGITPDAHISPQLLAALTAEGINPAADPLTQLKRRDLRRADIVVIFDTPPKNWTGKRLHDWTDTGSLNQSYAAERPRLVRRIDQLLDEIAASAPH